ncbi:hypothetical protein NS277_02505 [Novosphingobium barchaimii]|nr:hypothetical protein NS277_02505 [Novosphingobium barchaimii]
MSVMQKINLQAKVVQILDSYDRQAELMLLQAPDHSYILAVRSGDMESSDHLYLGGSMTPKRLRDYADGKCDLRFAIAHANLRRFWKFTYTGSEHYVEIEQIKRSDPELALSFPEPGLFATEHEDITVFKSFVPNTTEKFEIDGSWDLGEFAQFYSQVEDIYYISSDIDRFDDPQVSADEKAIISEAFDRSWDGGGSYVAFYKRVANDNDYHAPLRVGGIQYNSPGHVKIFARTEPFKNLMNTLQYYADNEVAARMAFSKLGRFMSTSGMKRPGFSSLMLTPAQRSNLEDFAKSASYYIPSVSFDTLMSMTKGNVLVSAKVLESIFRRIERLYKFFDQGRVAHQNLDVR